jgi:iron(III) transport system ATP-binding protein
MIQLENVTHAFPGKLLFQDLSQTIKGGQRVGLAGLSGSGKTTLLRLIAGLDAPQHGIIRIEGQVASSEGRVIIPPHLRRIGFVFQSPSLWPHMTVAQNVLFGLGKMPDTKAAQTLEWVLTQTGTAHLAQRMPYTAYSGVIRPPIPITSAHPFRSDPPGDSGASAHPLLACFALL